MSVTASNGYPAAFLDRDGTIMEDRHYVARAEDVVLLPGAAAAVRRLNEARVAVVIVTNQAGIARGFFDLDALARVQARLEELLAAEGARVDATYFCPHHPDFTGPCDCRKPGRALYDRAVDELALDARRSVFVGDRLHDVLPAKTFGGRGILVPSPDTPSDERYGAEAPLEVATSLGAAVESTLRALTSPQAAQ